MEDNIIELWEKVLDLLKEEISPIAFNTFISEIVPRQIDSKTISLLAKSSYHVDVCKVKYEDLIKTALKMLTSIDYEIIFEAKTTVPENDKINLDEEVVRGQYGDVESNGEMLNPILDKEKIRENAGLNKRFTFDNFIIGNNNRFAQATAYSVYENLGLTNPLFIYGGVGLGKTHLMEAIGNAVIDEDPSKKVLYCTGELFVSELIKVMLNPKNNEMNEQFKKKFRDLDLLLIDDVQIIAGKEKCQEEFFHTFNALCDSGKQIVLTSERPPKEINGLTDRLKTRFSMGVSVDIQTPDYETRLAILKKRAEEERYIVADDILVKVATKVKSNVRELEGVFNKLMAYTRFTNNQLTDDVVDNIIESILVKSSNVLSSTLVMQVVAQFFNIKVSDLTSDKRSNSIAKPRQIAMYLCREVADMSFSAIGNDFGGRDHSTVLHAYYKISDEYNSNADTKDLIDDIKKALERES
ncbi:MAG: chromosomal replication initiator protein DnaA [Clostridia bacterium]|nr:chromosomal replication initiator protein DnaA [Clostridia bacterium]